MRNRVRSDDQIEFVAAADHEGGSVVKVGAFLVVVLNAVKTGEKAVGERRGVYSAMPKATGAAWTAGDALYWDDTAKNFTKTATNNKLAGAAEADAIAGATVGQVLLAGLILA